MSADNISNSGKVSFQYAYSTTAYNPKTEDHCSTKQKLNQTEISMFSTGYTAKRINQIRPKSKIIIPQSLKSKSQSSQSSSIKSPDIKQSVKYASLKPFFNWKKYTPLCGFQRITGEDGCLCGNPCPLKQQWCKHYKQSYFQLYKQLLNQKPKEEDQIQILKDLFRTHPQCKTFSQNPRFQDMLKQMLICYSIYDPQIGYVQGMNIIAGVIVYHMKNAQLAFWAFVDLMDQQQLRMIYLQGFQMLETHSKQIVSIIQRKVFDLSQKMEQQDINPRIFLNGWLFSLMGSCIPLEYMHEVIDKFRLNGWKYIYQLIITYLIFCKEELLKCQDQSQFLVSLNTKNSRQYGIIWEEMIESALKLQIYQ